MVNQQAGLLWYIHYIMLIPLLITCFLGNTALHHLCYGSDSPNSSQIAERINCLKLLLKEPDINVCSLSHNMALIPQSFVLTNYKLGKHKEQKREDPFAYDCVFTN
jgi:hypothetical protein